jgi:hypothetical protein
MEPQPALGTFFIGGLPDAAPGAAPHGRFVFEGSAARVIFVPWASPDTIMWWLTQCSMA